MFLLASTGRSGTTYLRSLLTSNPDIGMDGEILYQDPTVDLFIFHRWWAEMVKQDLYWASPNNRSELVGLYFRFLSERPAAKKAVYGVDIKLEQLAAIPWFLPPLLKIKPKAILLKRANVLKQVVSEALMLKRLQEGHVQVHGSQLPPRVRVHLAPEHLLDRMRQKREMTIAFACSVMGLETFTVIYEDLVSSGATIALSKLQQFLGVPALELSSCLMKQNPDRLETLLTNYEEVRSAVAASEFEYTLYLPT